jgi:hypothetical protein
MEFGAEPEKRSAKFLKISSRIYILRRKEDVKATRSCLYLSVFSEKLSVRLHDFYNDPKYKDVVLICETS